jgi:ATP-dependent protease HslVU (ClpYQ) peptidase subunit
LISAPAINDLSRAGDHHGTQGVVFGQLIEGVGDHAFARHAQRVAARRVVDGEPGDTARAIALFNALEQQLAHFTSTRGIFNA